MFDAHNMFQWQGCDTNNLPALAHTKDTSFTQYSQILDWLKSGRTITPLEALERFGCLRLGARIYEMKRAGILVKREMVKISKNKRVARYSL